MPIRLLEHHKARLAAVKEKHQMDTRETQPPPVSTSREPSPLFEPEGSPQQQASQAPVAVMVPSASSTHESSPSFASSFITQLRDIEIWATAEKSNWAPEYLSPASDPTATTPQVPAKRKAAEISEDSNDDESDDEDSDSDNGEEQVPAHEPDNQIRPRLPIYHPGFKLTEDIMQKILDVFTNFITASAQNGYRDSEAARLRNEIIRKKNIKYQDSVRLAVAGDTGVGKSALLNALLGVLNLTIESDSGSACTCVITEFCLSDQSQDSPYAAEVKFFCLQACRSHVKDLFTQWFKVKQKQRQNPDDVDDNELSQMSTARDCLQDLFADRLDSDSVETFMATATSASDSKVLSQLLQWTTDIHQQFIQGGGSSVRFQASTPEALTELYHPFTRHVPNATYNGRPLRFTPWPFVEIVRVSLKSPILAQNVIIADVPGASDVNYFRVENAAQYLQGCHTTIVVGKIDRLQDNVSYRQQYLDAYRRRRSGSVILVATRSDDLNDENGSMLVLDPETETSLATINGKLVKVESKIRMITDEMERNRKEKKLKANKPLKRRKKKLMARKTAHETQRKSIRIAHRNKQVSRVVGFNYRQDTGDDAGAPVFCVSNRMYMRYLRGYDLDNEQSVPTMSIEDTQIPALISHIFALPSKGRIADLDHFAQVNLHTLLSIIEMSCSTTTLARVKHITQKVKQVREDIDTKVDKQVTKFVKTDLKRLEDELADHDLQSKFDAQATSKLTQWEKLPAATHKALCAKQGIHMQKKKGFNMNWNDELMSPMRPAIDEAFRVVLDHSCERFEAEAVQLIKDTLGSLDKSLSSDPQALAANAYELCLEKNKERYDQEISRFVGAKTKALRDGLIQVHLHALKVGKDDYFPNAMLGIYEEANLVRSSGKAKQTMKDARCLYLQEKIPGPSGPFSFLSGWVEEDSSKVINRIGEELRKDADDVFHEIQNNFHAMRDRKENDTPAGKVFRTDLQQLVAEARRIMGGIGAETLELCKQYK